MVLYNCMPSLGVITARGRRGVSASSQTFGGMSPSAMHLGHGTGMLCKGYEVVTAPAKRTIDASRRLGSRRGTSRCREQILFDTAGAGVDQFDGTFLRSGSPSASLTSWAPRHVEQTTNIKILGSPVPFKIDLENKPKGLHNCGIVDQGFEALIQTSLDHPSDLVLEQVHHIVLAAKDHGLRQFCFVPPIANDVQTMFTPFWRCFERRHCNN